MVSKAEKARRRALLEGDLKGAAAAEVSLLTAVMEAQFGPAHVEAAQGLIMMQVAAVSETTSSQMRAVRATGLALPVLLCSLKGCQLAKLSSTQATSG